MPTQVYAARARRFGTRLCAYSQCRQPFAPYTWKHARDPHGCCCKSHGGLHRKERGLCVLGRSDVSQKGGTVSAARKRKAHLTALAQLFGSPVTERDLEMYRLGWRQCYDRHTSRFKVRERKVTAREADVEARSDALEEIAC